MVLQLLLLAGLVVGALGGSCRSLNNCNGNGVCDTASSKCNCYNGWGSATDVALYKAPDCSQRTCPASNAWVDVPTGPLTAHAIAECSNAGLCDRSTGRCRCFVGYEGEACQRSACPGSPACSNQGKCMSLKNMASDPNAEPVGPPGSYGGSPATSTWDENSASSLHTAASFALQCVHACIFPPPVVYLIQSPPPPPPLSPLPLPSDLWLRV